MKSRLLIFEKLFFVALVIFVISYFTYDKLINSSPENKLMEQEKSTIEGSNILGERIVEFGMEFLGTPYVASGCSKDGFDCSGFVYFVFQNFKIEVPRSSADFDQFGEEIPIENVQKGDLLLFLSPTRNVIGHIGIVSNPNGSKSDFIHASSGREMKVIISSLEGKGYTDRFVKAIRVI